MLRGDATPEHTLSLGGAVTCPPATSLALCLRYCLQSKTKMTIDSLESIRTMGLLPLINECVMFIKLIQLEF